VYYLAVRYPITEHWVPFGEVGLISYRSSFDVNPAWYANGLRRFDLDDARGKYVAVGLEGRFGDHWSVDVYIRQVNVDVDGEYVFRGDTRRAQPFTFTLSHLSYGLGIRYRF
jgi:outer membrane protein W